MVMKKDFYFLFGYKCGCCFLHLYTVALDTLEILNGMTAQHNFSSVYMQYSRDCALSFSPELILVFSDFMRTRYITL